MRSDAPKARLIWLTAAVLLGLSLAWASGCVAFGTWSGDWRTPEGALLVLTPNQELASVGFTPDASMIGHFVASDSRHATVDWVVFPTPESAALGPRSTLTRSWNDLLLTSRSEADTYTVCVFPPYNASSASIGDLDHTLRLDQAVVDVTFLTKDDMLVRYKKAIQAIPQGAVQELEGGPIGACVLVSVKSSQDPAAFVHRVQTIPMVAARLDALDSWQRFVVIAGPRGERTIRFTHAKE